MSFNNFEPLKFNIGDLEYLEPILICDRCGNHFIMPESPRSAPNSINIFTDAKDDISEGIFYKLCPQCMGRVMHAISKMCQ